MNFNGWVAEKFISYTFTLHFVQNDLYQVYKAANKDSTSDAIDAIKWIVKPFRESPLQPCVSYMIQQLIWQRREDCGWSGTLDVDIPHLMAALILGKFHFCGHF